MGNIGICVDPASATDAGTAITDHGNQAKALLENQFRNVQPASDANPGWKTGPALVDFAHVRHREILSSLTELESIGQKIVEIVQSRVSVDARYADNLQRIEDAVGTMAQ
ncbi:hypothetical protein NDR87_31335 [Nocardia sp. CDC159]|uniref:Excreted virulence factor EspC (Type VII ESX diderm) n=1 Tax=Nocardia pulmonis TaxID=2951408 RepID=A0A9X2J2E6_9NOCA|nr:MULTISPECIES: hypothetical protein [Nocardia]MCM6777956.1 hypothetical protein [Nocardia pulmonis]MCM6790873.1 hypothetical protein [Nocardia sp. CDC159]